MQSLEFDNSTSTTQCIDIPIIDDDCVEDLEEFTATLTTDFDRVFLFGFFSAAIIVVDDDRECLYCVV